MCCCAAIFVVLQLGTVPRILTSLLRKYVSGTTNNGGVDRNRRDIDA